MYLKVYILVHMPSSASCTKVHVYTQSRLYVHFVYSNKVWHKKARICKCKHKHTHTHHTYIMYRCINTVFIFDKCCMYSYKYSKTLGSDAGPVARHEDKYRMVLVIYFAKVIIVHTVCKLLLLLLQGITNGPPNWLHVGHRD